MMPRRWQNPIVYAAALCVLLVYGGIVHISNRRPFRCLAVQSIICTLRGKIAGNPVRTAGGASYAVRVRAEEAVDIHGGKYSCTGEVAAFIDREIVEAYYPAALFSSSGRKGALLCESGANVELHGKFGRGGVFSVKTARQLDWGDGPLPFMRRTRAYCRARFRALMAFWGNAGGLLLALLSGMREYTQTETREAFRMAGLSHILALSGMHLSLVSGLALAAGKGAAGRRGAYAVQAAAVCAFVWFAGLSPSLLRAMIMAFMMLAMSVCAVTERDVLSILCAALLLHAVVAPQDMMSASFMFSYAALAGIVTAGEASESLASRAVPPAVSSLLCASIGAQLATIPISLYLFGEFMPIGVIASVAVSPVAVLFIYVGIALIALSLIFPTLAAPSGAIMGALYAVIRYLVLFFAKFPSVHIR